MYFTSKGYKYCVNCDWLQFSVLTNEIDPEIVCPDGLRIEICQGNNIFEHRALVFDGRGAKYLTLLWKPYSKVLQPNLMTVQVANEFLYMSGAGIRWAWDDVQKIVDCTFNAIGRVDICLDFEGTEYRNEFLRHLNSGHYYVQGKREGSTWWHTVDSNNSTKKQLHCLSWGSKKSEIKVKVYHKSREQGILSGEEPEKPWIVSEWKENEMDVRNVWRLEFSLSGAGQLRYKNQVLTLDMISNDEWLLAMMLELFAARFICRENQGKREGHHNGDKRVYLLELPNAISQLKWTEPKGKDHEIPASIILLRSMMRQIDNPIIVCHRPTFETYATAILDIVRTHKLDGYFLRTYEEEAENYFNNLWNNVGAGIHHTTPSPARLMD